MNFAFAVVVDWLMHIVVILCTIFLVDRQPGIVSVILAVMLNIIYIGQHLDSKQRDQYSLLVEAISQFAQAICNPSLAFFIAALNSYISLSRLKISMAALLLAHYRSDIAMAVFDYTGIQASWLVVEILQQGKIVLELQLTFAMVASILKCIVAWRQYVELHPLNETDGNKIREQLARMPRVSP